MEKISYVYKYEGNRYKKKESAIKKETKDFLLVMYKELFNNIDRHISLSWQSVSIIASSLGAFMLTEKFHVPIFLTVFFLIVIIVWTIARLIDAEHWYDRNIHIISNIEKIFLTEKNDAKNIHYYFTKQRTNKSRLESIMIQSFASTLLWMLTIVYFFWRIPKSIAENSFLFNIYYEFYFVTATSFLFALLLFVYKRYCTKRIEELRKQSPGITLN